MLMYWLHGFAKEGDSEPTLDFVVIADSVADAVTLANELPLAKTVTRIIEGESKPLTRRVVGCGPHDVCKTLWDWSISN